VRPRHDNRFQWPFFSSLLVVGASNILAGGALSGVMLGGTTHRENTAATIR